jgi:hypothetical protein
MLKNRAKAEKPKQSKHHLKTQHHEKFNLNRTTYLNRIVCL